MILGFHLGRSPQSPSGLDQQGHPDTGKGLGGFVAVRGSQGALHVPPTGLPRGADGLGLPACMTGQPQPLWYQVDYLLC